MRKGLAFLTALIATSTVLVSCGKEETAQKTETKVENKAPKPLSELAQEGKSHPSAETLPEGHPPIDMMPPNHPPLNAEHDVAAIHSGKNLTKFTKPINIPEEVQKTWKYATVDIVDRTTGKVVKEEKVVKGATIKFNGLEIKVLYIVPHLVLDEGYTSASNEPNNPAILVEVKENGNVIYAGPIYQKFPAMYNINHPKYILRLKEIQKG
ncbi:DUF2155 domain-containing protein [Phorcysia thermohydrogeniphila]|uniref:Lipoprotein n=1 Tax=Phorcysia thermohydrogeniphila TaxID=936138 RepID=A0A4R1G9W0_9BACT|nr:DUF2155 domain-containing protein [Phorcysia thermohydrogeniphila]TCK03453.1 hypothetical protein CLV27_1531 [Phorcysia thermohydrogeniphila]